MPKEMKRKRSRSKTKSRERSASAERKREHDERKQKKEEKRKMKEKETPEQRKARRIGKKMRKQTKEAQEEKLFGYTNDSNPFGDANLTTMFVWKKKYEQDIARGVDPRTLTKEYQRKKRFEFQKEIEKVKKRREERELEKVQMEEMRAQLQRDIDMEMIEGWEEKEENFHRAQAKLRSEIRIKEGREKAIDILAKNLNLFQNENAPDPNLPVDLDVELTEPYKIFDGLGIPDLEELKKDIQVYVELGANLEYWSALMTICDDELLKQKQKGGRNYLSPAVEKDVTKMFSGKSTVELASLEIDINKKLEEGEVDGAAIDVEYWEALRKQLRIFKAKSLLREFHADLLKKRLKQLKEQHNKEQQYQLKLEPKVQLLVEKIAENEAQDFEPPLEKKVKKDKEEKITDESGSLSPDLLHDGDETDAAEAIDPVQDAKELAAQRKLVLEQKEREEKAAKDAKTKANTKGSAATGLSDAAATSTTPLPFSIPVSEPATLLRETGMNRFQLTADEMYRNEADQPMDENEELFNNEVAIPDTPYWWHDKFRPRKPRYFNRVKTGYEWNKYNQTHYDKENPPPKIVQGYKFNIFYPDLIDATKTPRYVLEPDPTSSDYCIIRFIGGPPYEDIAFKIVKKEWEYSHKRGFKCVFDRGVLHLYFNFRRYRYRR